MLSSKQVERYERQLKEASGKYDLPAYQEERYRDFVVAMYAKGYEVRHYNGHNYFGPAVVVDRDRVEAARKAAGVSCLTDTAGFDLVIYPK